MHLFSICSMVGLSLAVAGNVPGARPWLFTAPAGEAGGVSAAAVAGGFVAPAAGEAMECPLAAATGERLTLDEAGADELATTRSCLTPRWGYTKEACAAFALASGASVEIELKEVLEGEVKKDEQVTFRLFDIIGQKQVDDFSLKIGGKHTFKNTSDALLDLVVQAKNDTWVSKRTITFTYEKK